MNGVTPPGMLENEAFTHYQALLMAVLYSAQVELGRGDENILEASERLGDNLRIAHRMLDRQVPCAHGHDGAGEVFIRARLDWYARAEVRELWERYLDAGYIDIDRHLHLGTATLSPSDVQTIGSVSPLEAAVVSGNVGSLRALLAAGADLSAPLSRNWDGVPTSRDGNGASNVFDGDPPVTDLLSLAAVKAPATQRDHVVAILSEGIMRTTIEQSRSAAARSAARSRVDAL